MSDMEDGIKEAHSRSNSRHSEREDGEDSKHERYSNNSRERSRSRISDGHKSHSRRDYSRSRSRSHSRSRKSHRSSRYRSRSRSPKRYKSSRYMYSRSRSGSYSPSYKSSRRDRSRSRSPMSNRRRHLGNRWGKKPYKNTNSKDNPLPSRCLGVFGLSIYTTEQQLNHIFSKFGPIEKVQVIIDAKTGRSRGFCFVYFENHEDAKAAKEQCTGMEIDGRQIRVDYSITLRAHTPTPGIYMGKPTYMEDRKWKHRNYDDYHYGGGGGRYNHYKRSPSPYFRNRRRYNRSRSYSYSPRRY